MAKKTKLDCDFCTIASGGSAVSVVDQTDSVLVLMDIQPVNPGHVLVIPRAHATYLADLDPAVGGEIFEAGMRVAAGLRRSGLRFEGVNFFLADGDAAGRKSFTSICTSSPGSRVT